MLTSIKNIATGIATGVVNLPSAVVTRVKGNYNNLGSKAKVASIATPAVLSAGSIGLAVLTKLGFLATPIGAGAAGGAALLALVVFAAVFLKNSKTSATPTAFQKAVAFAKNNKSKVALGLTAAAATTYLGATAVKAGIRIQSSELTNEAGKPLSVLGKLGLVASLTKGEVANQVTGAVSSAKDFVAESRLVKGISNIAGKIDLSPKIDLSKINFSF